MSWRQSRRPNLATVLAAVLATVVLLLPSSRARADEAPSPLSGGTTGRGLAAGTGSSADLSLSQATVDPTEVRRLLEEARVQTDPPRASLVDWTAQVIARVVGWLLERLSLSAGMVEWIPMIAEWLAIALLALGLVTIVWIIARWARQSRQEAQPAPGQTEAKVAPGPLEADAWLERFEGALEAGMLAEALTSLWGWLATRLAGPEPDPSWTTGELLRISRRVDLRAPLNELDAMVYGASPVDATTIRSLAASLRSQV